MYCFPNKKAMDIHLKRILQDKKLKKKQVI